MFKEDYRGAFSKLSASPETYRRVLNMTNDYSKHLKPKRRRARGLISKVLIAAVMVSLLAVTASAAETVRDWFAGYFASRSGGELSPEQVTLIEQNTQKIGDAQERGGWTVELHSALSDGVQGYILFSVTAPEGMSLADLPEETGYVGPGNDFISKDETNVLRCTAFPDGYVVGGSDTSWVEDGDGLDNTVLWVIHMTPEAGFAASDPFGPDAQWHVRLDNFVRGHEAPEVLAEGSWNFDFTFQVNDASLELLDGPVKTRTCYRDPSGEDVLGDVTLNSVELGMFGVTVRYGDDSDGIDYSHTAIYFEELQPGWVDCCPDGLDPWYAVMKDGTRFPMRHTGGNPNDRCSILATQVPLVLEEADHLLLPDGVTIPVR